MDSAPSERHIMEWDESDVHAWFSSLGYPQYEHQIKEHNISGDVLCMLGSEGLKGVGVATIGQRLAILKAVYNIKLVHNVPIEPDHYVPPSEAQDREGVTVEKLHDMVKDQAQRLRNLEEENRLLNESLQLFLDDFNTLQLSQRRPSDGGPQGTLNRQPSFKWAQYVKPARSPTKPDIIESPQPSPQQLEHDVPSYNRNTIPQPQYQPSSAPSHKTQPPPPQLPNGESIGLKPNRQESSDNLKSFKVTLDDPTWKVLPAALKKYKINNDNWQNYAMFICYGSTGNRIERCLSYDEKPLLLFQKLKDAKKNPVFMLKHIKDIRSPIVVAQQKHAARKASSSEPSSSSSQGRMPPSSNRTHTRPPRLEVNDLTMTPNLSGVSPQPPWLEVMSPGVEKDKSDDLSAITPTASFISSANEGSRNRAGSSTTVDGESHGGGGNVRETPVALAGVSYAVAIYPYMAEQEDEFDVVVGDTFVILSRARGWWVVQRDPSGSGIVDTDMTKQGWVPAGCLLETNVPVASAIKLASSGNSPPSSPRAKKTPILPLSIISTSFPGIALMDYEKKGEEELDLVKDEPLRVFKRYNHWSYAVKEEGGDRGWVPSWFIGKVANASGVPPVTPSASAASAALNSASVTMESENAQVSPMSSAFPPVRSATTMI